MLFERLSWMVSQILKQFERESLKEFESLFVRESGLVFLTLCLFEKMSLSQSVWVF